MGNDFGYIVGSKEAAIRGRGARFDRSRSNVLAGKPIIRGTRLSVDFVIGLLADGWSEVDILANYPGIKREDILACLANARETLRSERV